MKTGIKVTNYWAQKVQYVVRSAAQSFLTPHCSVISKNAVLAASDCSCSCSCGSSCDITSCSSTHSECTTCSLGDEG